MGPRTVSDAVGPVGVLSRRTALRRLGGAAIVAVGASGGLRRAPASAQENVAPVKKQVYFGWLLGSSDIAAVALEVGEPDEAGVRAARGYVCNGLGDEAGVAVWFTGPVDQAVVDRKTGEHVRLSSPTGQETFLIGHLDAYAAAGAYTGADGRTYRYVAFPARDGAGIYDVTLDDNLRYHGMSTDGSELVAQAHADGLVEGTISTADGQEIAFHVQVLALVPEAELAAHGLPASYTQFAANSIVPDAYVALIAPAGVFWLGRNGDIRKGTPGNNIIGLDMCE
ncbi:MAG: hypothetical protein ACRDJH_04560 [Thermomicrobiales bacterium]